MSPRFLTLIRAAGLGLLLLNAAGSRAAAAPTAFTSDRLVAELTHAVAAHFENDGDLQLTLLRPWAPPARTATAWSVSVLEYPNVIASTMMVRCRVSADGVAVAEPSLMVRAALWRDVWFSRQPLGTGTSFTPSALEARRVDCLRERNALSASVGDPSMMFSRDVPADRMLTWHDLVRRPLVRKGEWVEVVASEGSLSLSMKALALQNGVRGDLITVRNPESLKDFSGLVVDDHRVQVHF